MDFPDSVTALIQKRISWRNFQPETLSAGHRTAIEGCLSQLPTPPFGGGARFTLAAAEEEDRSALRGLGTYGLIRGATAFLIGVCRPEPQALVDFAYQLEAAVLFATGLGVGSCWLGGNFTRSSFGQKIEIKDGEIVPAVIALGYPTEKPGGIEILMRRQVRARERLPWEQLFFEGQFGAPLTAEASGAYAPALEMLRIGPSASNKQPWRAVRDGPRYHFYVQRTPGYRDNFMTRLLGVADMQRVDLGIAMCHFELSARQAGLAGGWQAQDPRLPLPDDLTEYVATWAGE